LVFRRSESAKIRFEPPGNVVWQCSAAIKRRADRNEPAKAV